MSFVTVNQLTRIFDLSKPWIVRTITGQKKRVLTAVDCVNFQIEKGETYALVGESGSGKSTIAKMVAGLLVPTSGSVIIDNKNFNDANLEKASMNALRRKTQMVFQSPYASLNPRWKIGNIINEPIKAFGLIEDENGQHKRVIDLLEQVGLSERDIKKYPHEFSGGQRQRIGVARALILEPDFVVCDEPISALDVSVQAQVVNLLAELKESMGLTLLFIAHDLSMVRYISDRMAVMYLGGLVEVGDADEVFFKPMHPYTKTLIASNPEADPRSERQRVSTTIQGEIPSPVNIPAGCRFANRCPQAMPVCHQTTPVLKTPTVAKAKEHFDENRQIACHLYD